MLWAKQKLDTKNQLFEENIFLKLLGSHVYLCGQILVGAAGITPRQV